MIRIYFTLSILLFSRIIIGQITITSDDMPSPGDSYLVSRTTTLNFDPNETGPDFNWDFTDLIAASQDTILFNQVSSTPFFYQLVFNNPFDPTNQATEASPVNTFGFIPNIDLTDVFLFTKNSTPLIEQVGLGFTFNGLPAPIAYTDKRLVYNFPMNFEDTANDNFNLELDVPNQAFISESGTQNYVVDGWGTLTTSFGSFDVLRVQRTVNQTDTIFLDSLGSGFGITREITSYEWLGQDTGIPLLIITTEFGLVTSVVYQDFPLVTVGIDEIDEPVTSFSVYPQPAQSSFNIGFNKPPNQLIDVFIYDLSGKLVWSDTFNPGKKISIDENFNKGIYLLEIKIGGFNKVKKLIIQ